MSATPRPWGWELNGTWTPHWEWRVGHLNNVPTKYEAAMIPKEIFDALLAVAKAASGLDRLGERDDPGHEHREFARIGPCALCEQLEALDAAYPGWREWAP